MILADKVALVVGGGESIGRTIAATLAQEGASTAICSRLREKEPEVVAELRGAVFRPSGLRGTCWIHRVWSLRSIGWLIDTGSSQEPADYNRIVDSQLISRLNCLYAALRPMVSTGYGKVVFLTTDAGRTPPQPSPAPPQQASYFSLGPEERNLREKEFGLTASPYRSPPTANSLEEGQAIPCMKRLMPRRQLRFHSV